MTDPRFGREQGASLQRSRTGGGRRSPAVTVAVVIVAIALLLVDVNRVVGVVAAAVIGIAAWRVVWRRRRRRSG